MKIAIIGLGLIGCERIEAIQYISKLNNNIKISSVFDTDQDTLHKVQKKYNVPVIYNLDDLDNNPPDWIFISAPNFAVYDIAKKAFSIGSNVLIEKPFGRSLEECDKIIALKPNNLKLNIGFNYRFFSGIEKAIYDAKSGKFGDLVSVNFTLAHGNAPNMNDSWKLDPIKCGDCITDLGVHILNLMNLLSDNVKIDHVSSWSGFWNTGIIEESHIIASCNKTIFNTQISYNRWRSTFKIEINGTEGYGIVEGRGRSYGNQSYRIGKRWGWSQNNKKQIDTEQIIVDNYDCRDSFFNETISVLNLSDIDKSLFYACDYLEARNTMILLKQCKDKLL